LGNLILEECETGRMLSILNILLKNCQADESDGKEIVQLPYFSIADNPYWHDLGAHFCPKFKIPLFWSAFLICIVESSRLSHASALPCSKEGRWFKKCLRVASSRSQGCFLGMTARRVSSSNAFFD
jgi:hypothetical protein